MDPAAGPAARRGAIAVLGETAIHLGTLGEGQPPPRAPAAFSEHNPRVGSLQQTGAGAWRISSSDADGASILPKGVMKPLMWPFPMARSLRSGPICRVGAPR